MVIAGRNRNADDYRDFWVNDADRRGLLIVAPEFNEAQYAHPQAYNYCAMVDGNGALAPKSEWIFPVIEGIFQDAKLRAHSTRSRYFLFGHSAGSQLVHRLVMFGWSPSIEMAIGGNAGSYTLPTADDAFPFGVVGTGLDDDARRAMFERPLTIHLGDRDIDPNDPHLPREPGAMHQGPHRFARGHFFIETARREAERLGAKLAWTLAVVPGVAHSGAMMSPFAARAFFD